MDRTFRTFFGAPLVMLIRFCVARSLATSGAADEVRSRHQSEHGQSVRADSHRIVSGPRRRGDRMIARREFITLLGGAAVTTVPLAARAQYSVMPMVAFLNSSSPDGYVPMVTAFRQGLKEAGCLE